MAIITAEDVANVGDSENICCISPFNAAGELIAEANIPEPCRGEYGIYVDWDTFPSSGMGMTLEEAQFQFEWGMDLWNNAIEITLLFEDSLAHAKTYVDFRNLSGTTLAWSSLANNSCIDDKKQRYDERRWNAHQFGLTVGHEFGHLIGLHHKNGPYLMNPYILTSLEGLTQNDIDRAVGLGYELQDGVIPVDPKPNKFKITSKEWDVVFHGKSGVLPEELHIVGVHESIDYNVHLLERAG